MTLKEQATTTKIDQLDVITELLLMLQRTSSASEKTTHRTGGHFCKPSTWEGTYTQKR